MTSSSANATLQQSLISGSDSHASYTQVYDVVDDGDDESTTGGSRGRSGGGGRGRGRGCCASFRAFRQSPSAVMVVVSLALFVDLLVYCIIIP